MFVPGAKGTGLCAVAEKQVTNYYDCSEVIAAHSLLAAVLKVRDLLDVQQETVFRLLVMAKRLNEIFEPIPLLCVGYATGSIFVISRQRKTHMAPVFGFIRKAPVQPGRVPPKLAMQNPPSSSVFGAQ